MSYPNSNQPQNHNQNRNLPADERPSPFQAKQYGDPKDDLDHVAQRLLDAMADEEEQVLQEMYLGKAEGQPEGQPDVSQVAQAPSVTDPLKPPGEAALPPKQDSKQETSELREFIAAQTKMMAEMMVQFQQAVAPKPAPEPAKPKVPQIQDFRTNPVAALQDAGVSLDQLRLHMEAQNTTDPVVKSQLQTLQLQQQIEQLQARLEAQQAAAEQAAQQAAAEQAIAQSYKGFTARDKLAEQYPTIARVLSNDPAFAENAFRAHLSQGRSPEEAAQVLEGVWANFLKAAAAPAPAAPQPEAKNEKPPANVRPAAPTPTNSTQPSAATAADPKPTNWYNRVQRDTGLKSSQELLAELLRKG